MNVEVIGAFIDRQTKKRIKPGDPLPASISADEERLKVLRKTGCVRVIGETQTQPQKAEKPKASTAKKKSKAKQPAAKEAVGAGGLFPSDGEDAAGTGASTDPAAVAGGDGGDSGAGAQSDEAGQPVGDGESQDDSSR